MTKNNDDKNLKKDNDQAYAKSDVDIKETSNDEDSSNDLSINQDSSNQELQILKEKLLRVNADFQNYKRRVEKEKTEWIDIGQAKVIEAFLTFVDDLDLALGSWNKDDLDEKTTALLEGFLIIQKKLKKTLEDLGVKQIDCSGKFDPNFHEALMQVESKDHESNQIVQVFNSGYLFKGKVLRHAKVSVAK